MSKKNIKVDDSSVNEIENLSDEEINNSEEGRFLKSQDNKRLHENHAEIYFEDLNNEELNFDNTWSVIKEFVNGNDLTAHQKDSFNDCLRNMIPDIIKDPVNNPVVVTHEREENGEKITDIEYKIYFTNVSISKPLIQ